jgi:hypothetical protein
LVLVVSQESVGRGHVASHAGGGAAGAWRARSSANMVHRV